MELKILVPQATTNYIKNPAVRNDTSGWAASGSTISRSLEQARFGIASLKVVTSGSVLNEGLYYRVSELENLGGAVTVSAYVRGSGSVRIRLIDNPTGSEWSSRPIALSASRWRRIEASGIISGSNDIRLYVETSRKDGPQAITYYVACAQMERGPRSTTYCDGNQPGCRWNVVADSTRSSRSADTRSGGRWYVLAGPEREREDLYMTVVGGLGAASITNITQPYANLPGAFHQGTRVNERLVTLSFHAKNKQEGRPTKGSLDKLHELRQYLLDTVKPDRVSGNEEILFGYKDGDTEIYFKARYDGGLEGEWDVRNYWSNSFPVRLLVVSPFLYEDDQEVSIPDLQESQRFNAVAGRIDGSWSILNGGLWGGTYDRQVNSLAVGANGEIYACGSFSNANYGGAIDPDIPVSGIAYWDGEAWNGLGTGANGTVHDMAVAPNGDLYVVGEFTVIGGVSANRVAYWDGSTWNALTSGLSGNGYAVAVTQSGEVFVGGDFSTAGGVASENIARWTGSSWAKVGFNSGLNGTVRGLTSGFDLRFVYACGDFTDEFGDPGTGLPRVALYDVASDTFDALGAGFDDTCLRIKTSPSGIVYACGEFELSGGEGVGGIARWNGAVWLPLGAGASDSVRDLDISPDGKIVAVGDFLEIGNITAEKIALWNGSMWLNLDIDLPAWAEPSAVVWSGDDIYFGGGAFYQDSFGSSSLSSNAHVFDLENDGSADTQPVVYLNGPLTMRYIENQSAKRTSHFNLEVLDGETVEIDFENSKITSRVRGLLTYTVLAGSDFGNFILSPGTNRMALFASETGVSSAVSLVYVPRHWSADATSRRN